VIVVFLLPCPVFAHRIHPQNLKCKVVMQMFKNWSKPARFATVSVLRRKNPPERKFTIFIPIGNIIKTATKFFMRL
jgi:hypothetical protein